MYDVATSSFDHLMDEPSIGSLSWSPDGRYLAFFAGAICPASSSFSECNGLWQPNLKIVSLENGAVQTVVPYEQLYESLVRRAWNRNEQNANAICYLIWSPNSRYLSFISGKQCWNNSTVKLSDRDYAEVYLVDIVDHKLRQLTDRSKLQQDEIANGYTGISVVYSLAWKGDSNDLMIGWYRPTWNLNLPPPKDIGPVSWGIDVYQPSKNQTAPIISENKDKYVKYVSWSPNNKYLVWEEQNNFQPKENAASPPTEMIVSQVTDQFTVKPIKRYDNNSAFLRWLPDNRMLFVDEIGYKILNVDNGQTQNLELSPSSRFMGIIQHKP